MAWTTPSTRSTGALITAAIWNSDVVANPIALFARDAMLLLKASSGTTTNTSAENVDTIAITGLTAKDTLLVLFNIEAVTQNAGNVETYNATDAVTLASLGGPLAGEQRVGHNQMRQNQAGATSVDCASMRVSSAGIFGETAKRTFTTNWTGSWTLALRQAGVVSGGTLRWSWAAYKVAGQ